MLLSCPNCGTVTEIADILIPSARLTATCAGCGGKIGGTVPARLDQGNPKAKRPKKGRGGFGRPSKSRAADTSERRKATPDESVGVKTSAGRSERKSSPGARRGEAGSGADLRKSKSVGGRNVRADELKPAVTDPVKPSLGSVARGLDPERLAKLVASDMLLYNRDKVQKTLAEGCLLSSMASEIAEAWDFYKRRVGVHTALGTSYFRDALNSVISGGDPVI